MKTQEAALTHTIRIANQPAQVKAPVAVAKRPILLRHVIGEQLRHLRNEQNRTLREVSRAAQVSLGYLSEVETPGCYKRLKGGFLSCRRT